MLEATTAPRPRGIRLNVAVSWYLLTYHVQEAVSVPSIDKSVPPSQVVVEWFV